MILPCTCNHPGQDELNGKNMRVHNWAKGANQKNGAWKCTVCGNIKAPTKTSQPELKDKKKG